MESVTLSVLIKDLETARESLNRVSACLLQSPKITAGAPNKVHLAAPDSAIRNPPIVLITENGFSIVRLCEREPSTRDSASECHFVVRGPSGGEHSVTVGFTETEIGLVQIQRELSASLSPTSAFWLQCAERYLATYLWKNNTYPPDGTLIVGKLSVEDLLMARRWDQSRSE